MSCSKRMNRCRPNCLHRALVREYYDAYDARESLRERGEGMLMEDYEFLQRFPPVTFKMWLKGRHV